MMTQKSVNAFKIYSYVHVYEHTCGIICHPTKCKEHGPTKFHGSHYNNQRNGQGDVVISS